MRPRPFLSRVSVLLLGTTLLTTTAADACGCGGGPIRTPVQPVLALGPVFYAHSRVLRLGPGPVLHLKMRSYIWCHTQTPDINVLGEPCDDPHPDTITDSIHITARLDAVSTHQCGVCRVYVMTASNAPLVYPVGREVILYADTRYKGVLDVGLYVHLTSTPTGGLGSDVVVSHRDTLAYTAFCSPVYFGQHPGALAADHYPCGA